MSYNDVHPDNDRVVQGQRPDSEIVILNPAAKPGDVDAKPNWRLKDLYPNIENYRSIPASIYTNPASIELEWERLWTKTWLFAGPASDIPGVGDWFRFDVGRESIIVARDSKGHINAFYNVCRHRGTRLALGDSGRGSKGFLCPFHGWRYGLDGKNQRVTDRDTFAPATLCNDVDIPKLQLGIWNGLIFVSMNDNPQPLDDYLGDLTHMVVPYKMDKMFVVKDAIFTMPANWKTTADAFQEIYHTQATHPQFKPVVDDYFVQFDFYRNGHNRQLVPFLKKSPRLAPSKELHPLYGHFMRELGIDFETFVGGPEEARRAVQEAKRKPNNVFGIDYSNFTDDQLVDDWNITIFPHITFNMHPEGVLIQRFRPHPTDVDKCFYDVLVLVPKMKGRPPVYMGVEPEVDTSGHSRPARIYVQPDESHRLGQALDQDVSNLPRVQAGLYSKGVKGMVRFAEHERRIQQFYAEFDLYLKGPKGN
jgi:phenylpropionate dioxygenase-like ring-hydroxylating dioxygenase large terminal subunit